MNNTTEWVSVQRGLLFKGSSPGFDVCGDSGCRSSVGDFSSASRKRLLHHLRNSEAEYRFFATLTYPPELGRSGPDSKAHLKSFMERLKRVQLSRHYSGSGLDGRPWSVVWFQEWQRNGRIHFHLCSSHYVNKQWLSENWYQVVGSGNENHLNAGTNIKPITGGRDGMCRYAIKYVTKSEQKDIPAGFGWAGRFWGIWGDRTRVAAATAWKPSEPCGPALSHAINALKAEIDKRICFGDLIILPTSLDDYGIEAYTLPRSDHREALCALVRAVDEANTNQLDDRWYVEERDRRESLYDLECDISNVSRETISGGPPCQQSV